MEFEVTIPVPMWMYVDRTVLDMYASEMWRNIVRMSGLTAASEPGIMYQPHADRYDAINVVGTVTEVPQPAPSWRDAWTRQLREETAEAFRVNSYRMMVAQSERIPVRESIQHYQDEFDDGFDEHWADAARWHPGRQ